MFEILKEGRAGKEEEAVEASEMMTENEPEVVD